MIIICCKNDNCMFVNNNRFLYIALALVLSVGCASTKDILYFQDIDQVRLAKKCVEYSPVIKKGDQLIILVSGPDKTVTQPYRPGRLSRENGNQSSVSGYVPYIVDSDGYINYHVLGKIHVEGMTRAELVNYLTTEIGKDVPDVVVSVQYINYKVTVLGAVQNPGTYSFEDGTVTIFQAIAEAGDLTFGAERNVLLLREVDGVMTHASIDLTNCDILESPYLFMQSNDCIYVHQTQRTITRSTAPTGIWAKCLTSISAILVVLRFIL